MTESGNSNSGFTFSLSCWSRYLDWRQIRTRMFFKMSPGLKSPTDPTTWAARSRVSSSWEAKSVKCVQLQRMKPSSMPVTKTSLSQ